jgi:hypothetical protein
MLNSGQNDDPDSYRECDAGDDSSNAAWQIKIFLN